MSGATREALAAIEDARALLRTMTESGWDELHVRSGDTEIFIAREIGRPDPLCVDVADPEPVPPARGMTSDVTVPHVASVVDMVPVGTRVAVGERVATLRVLDEEQPLLAASAGTVVAHAASRGELVDYGATVATLEADV